MRVLEYLTTRSAQLDTELPGDCLNEATRIAELLLDEEKRPWIGRIRDRRGALSGLLYAWRFEGRGAPGWTSHYVCCVDDVAFDPIIGAPVPVGELAQLLFRRDLPVERVLDVVDCDDVRTAIRRAVCAPSSTDRRDRHPSASS